MDRSRAYGESWNDMVCWYIWYRSQDILHVLNSGNSMVFEVGSLKWVLSRDIKMSDCI